MGFAHNAPQATSCKAEFAPNNSASRSVLERMQALTRVSITSSVVLLHQDRITLRVRAIICFTRRTGRRG
jgi:hypothetical protein